MTAYGADRIGDHPGLIAGRRLGLVTNHTGLDADFTPTADILHAHADLACIFSPEHGLSGTAQAGDAVRDSTDPRMGLPVHSLYGDSRRPDARILSGLDAVVFDIQDVGLRFYTYTSTLSFVMEACAEAARPCIVLDRPNPLGGLAVEGLRLDPAFSSFVGRYPIPARYGLTIGELALYLNSTHGIGCLLEVAQLSGWHRGMYWPDTGLRWVPPSPNLPTFESVLAYAAACPFEGTNVSEGRGTTRPFETIGAPWIDGERLAKEMNGMRFPGVVFRPVSFAPAFSKHAGIPCGGVQMHIDDVCSAPLFEVGIALLYTIRNLYPDQFQCLPPWSPNARAPLDLLTGNDMASRGIPMARVIERAREDSEEFLKARAPFLLYPEGPGT